MNRLTKSLALLVAAGSLTAWRAPAAGSSAPTNAPARTKTSVKAADLFPDTVVAKGKGVEIKRSLLDDEVIRIKAQAAANNQTIRPDQVPLLEQQILDTLIQLQLLKARSTEADRTAAKIAAEKRLEDIKNQLGSEESLARHLKVQGVTRDELIVKWTEIETAKAVLSRELNIVVTDADIKKYYDENPAQFEEPEMVRASHILLTTRDLSTGTELSAEQKAAKRKMAEDLLKRARAGEDFAKLVKDYSDDPGSRNKGGEYTFARASASADPRRAMPLEFETAAFSLKTNEVSDIVTTQIGYHIIKLNEKIPAKKQHLATASPRIKDYLTQQGIQKQGPPHIEKLKKEAGVEILDPKLKLPEVSTTAAALPPGHPSIKPETKPETK